VLTLPYATWSISEIVSTSGLVRNVLSRDSSSNLTIGTAGTGSISSINIAAGGAAGAGVYFTTGSSSQYRTTIDYNGNLTLGNTLIVPVGNGNITVANTQTVQVAAGGIGVVGDSYFSGNLNAAKVYSGGADVIGTALAFSIALG